MSAASARAAAEGGRLSLRLQGPLVSKAASTTFSKRPGMLGPAQRAALAGRQDLVGGQQSAGEGLDVYFVNAQPPEEPDLRSDLRRRHRVVIAPQRYKAVARHLATE